MTTHPKRYNFLISLYRSLYTDFNLVTNTFFFLEVKEILLELVNSFKLSLEWKTCLKME